jgi:hypothetical protein
MYKLEKTENFRAVAQLFLSQCTSSVELTTKDVVDVEVQGEIEDIGQYTELAHGKVDPSFVWKHLDRFMGLSGSESGTRAVMEYPLVGYSALKDSELVASFYGKVEKLQGYIAYRPKLKQLIVAFSGTSSFAQTRHNLKAYLVRYEDDSSNNKPEGKKSKEKDEDMPKIHAGFHNFYEGIRDIAFKELAKGLVSKQVDEVVFTGHSLGGAMAYLFALDLMTGTGSSETTSAASSVSLPSSIPMKVVVFGCPRIGNAALADCWRKAADKKGPLLKEYSVRGYNDGEFSALQSCLGYHRSLSSWTLMALVCFANHSFLFHPSIHWNH